MKKALATVNLAKSSVVEEGLCCKSTHSCTTALLVAGARLLLMTLFTKSHFTFLAAFAFFYFTIFQWRKGSYMLVFNMNAKNNRFARPEIFARTRREPEFFIGDLGLNKLQ